MTGKRVAVEIVDAEEAAGRIGADDKAEKLVGVEIVGAKEAAG
jgi:hypothetical protein